MGLTNGMDRGSVVRIVGQGNMFLVCIEGVFEEFINSLGRYRTDLLADAALQANFLKMFPSYGSLTMRRVVTGPSRRSLSLMRVVHRPSARQAKRQDEDSEMGITRHGVAAFISPKIPEITKCVCVDVAQEFPSRGIWLGTFFIKVGFQNHAPQEKRALCVQTLRRAETALAEYSAGCDLMAEVAGGGGTGWAEYFKALYRFEATLSQLYQATNIPGRLSGRMCLRRTMGRPWNG